MIKLDNYRIVAIDSLNITFEHYKEVENLRTKEKTTKWVRVGGYYGNLRSALNGLKEYIINQEIQKQENVDILKVLDELNQAYVNCNLKAR